MRRLLGVVLLAGRVGAPAADTVPAATSAEAATLRAVLRKVDTAYVEPTRIDPARMLREAVRALDREVPEVRLASDPEGDPLALDVAGARLDVTLASVRTLPDLEAAAGSLLAFVAARRAPSSKPVAEYVAINAMLATLDPHSMLLDPAEAKEFATNLRSRFSGIGIVFNNEGTGGTGARPGIPVVTEVLKGGPAERAGFAACDRILAVDDRWAAGLDWTDLAGLLRGPEGSSVRVTLLRDGAVKDFLLTRAAIQMPSVTSRRLDGDVGLIRIQAFVSGTAAEVRAAVAELRRAGASAFVLDLRDNPGGLLGQAVATAGIFVRAGPVVTVVGERGAGREVRVASRGPNDVLEEGPLAVLVGPSTASSAEVLAAALQNRNRAVLLGRTSWGKGSVQVLYDEADASKLKLTVAHYLTPGGASLQARGIAPDVELVPVPVPAPRRIRLGAAEAARHEADLERAFAPREAPRRAAVSLRYLAANPDAEDEVLIARDLVQETRSSSRGDTLEGAAAFLRARRDAEDAKIASVLAAAGVDWSAGPGDAARLAIRCAQTAAVREGRVPLACEIRNEGASDAHRVHGRARPPAFDLRDEEIVVGRVPAGARVDVAVEGDLAEDPGARVSFTTFAFSTGDGSRTRDVAVRVEATRRSRPQPEGGPRLLEIDVDAGSAETTDGARTVKAAIRGPGVRDAWIRVSNATAKVNGKKVAYVAGAASPALAVAADVPLRVGLNAVDVCSRAGTEERCETAFVYRHASP